MARVIDEIVQGVGLFIPDAHDYFSVDSGGLPNGDDCLIVHGDVSQDYRAFVNLVPDGTPLIASPRIDLPNMDSGWALSFWLKWSAETLPATPTTANTIMGVFSQTVPAVRTIGGATNPTYGVSWLMGAGGTNGDLLRLGGSWKSSGGTRQDRYAEQTVPVGGWHLIVFNADDTLTASTAANMFLDQGIVGGGGGSSDNTAAGISGGTYLSIGHYADTSGAGGRSGEWRIGKIAFHDHPLNETERNVLYRVMLGL